MARKAYGLHATQVNTSTYPDDGSSPVGSNEWNEALDTGGMLGFLPATANSSTIIVSSGVATITDSVSVIAGEGAATDTLQKLALANTSQYDLVYLFAASSGYVVTLEHGDLNADGEISTVSGSNETLSTTVPTILIRKGNYWYGYGGGVVNAVSDIGDVTITSNSSGELLKWNGSAWINQTLTEAGVQAAVTFGIANTNKVQIDHASVADNDYAKFTASGVEGRSAAQVLGDISAIGTSLADGYFLMGNGSNVANTVTPSGDVDISNSGVFSIVDNKVDEANLKVSNGPTNGQFLSAQSGNTGGLTWAAAGGTHTEQGWDVYTSHTGSTTASDGTAYMFARRIDSNNDGLYIMLWKNGASTEVQIA